MKLRTSEEFLEAMWSALIESPDFKPMIDAWDRAIADTTDQPEQPIEELAQALSGDLARLEVALEALAKTVQHDPSLLRDHVDSFIKLDQQQEIVSQSLAFERLGLDLTKLQEEVSRIDFSASGMQLIWGSALNGTERFLLALTPLDASSPLPQTFLVKSLETDWPAEYEAVLSRMFALSPAEMEVLKDLYLGFESSVIAQRRDRSVHTVRTQIKSLMEKMGVNNQRRLVRLLSTLFQLDVGEDQADRDIGRGSGSESCARRTLNLGTENQVEYCDYGDPQGAAIFLITPTINPIPSHYIIKLANRQAVRVIAPFRPGSGSTTPREFKHGPLEIAQDYARIIDELAIEQFTVVGCDSGGLYAAALAGLMGSPRCAALVHIGTGAPMRSIAPIMKMSPSSRRTFLVAR